MSALARLSRVGRMLDVTSYDMARNNRVCVAFPFVGDSIGGSHVSALELADALDVTRYDAVVVSHVGGPLRGYLAENHPSLRHVSLPLSQFGGVGRRLRSGYSLLACAARIMPFIVREKIDLIHTNDSRIHNSWSLPATLLRRGLVRHHRAARFGGGQVDKMNARLADAIICISEFTRASVPPRLSQRATVIDNPFAAPDRDHQDAAEVRCALMRELAVTADALVLGFFGNFLERKRPDEFLSIVSRVMECSGREVVGVLCGEDRDDRLRTLRATAERLGIAHRIVFAGFVDPVWPYMRACDVAVFPAVDEPFGRVLVEAMLAGTLVVAANSGGHREIVSNSDFGVLVEPGDVNGFAEAVCSLLDDPARAAAMASAARVAALDRFSVGRHAREVEAVYEKVLSGSSSH